MHDCPSFAKFFNSLASKCNNVIIGFKWNVDFKGKLETKGIHKKGVMPMKLE